jgi:hypothetical protein
MMNKEDIERILHLQNSAYNFLLWLNKRSESEPEILSDQNIAKWRFAESCETWIRTVYGGIPQALRPPEEDIPAFAHLFSSFFQTSFRLHERDYDGKRSLMAGPPSGKKSAKGKAKIGESARELRLIALEALAIENDLLLSRGDLEEMERDEKLHDALVMWTYFHELNRRANFGSQGEAVHALWQAIDKKERERMSADKILKAHERLVTALISYHDLKFEGQIKVAQGTHAHANGE